MRVWVDLSNSPHVPLLDPVVRRLRADRHEVLLTVRDHAQTLDLARGRWEEFRVVGGSSPSGRMAKGRAIARRAEALRRFGAESMPDVAFSHGSYAQLIAAHLAGVPAVTMMDYEHQPANHLSFRLASRVIVPAAFPDSDLRRCGARPAKVIRYPGFKEELYLTGFEPDPSVLDELKLDPGKVIAVLRPPPEGALYHRMANARFDSLVRLAAESSGVQALLLPRAPVQAERYGQIPGVVVPRRPVDGASLLALSDLVIGAGGTMNRESAVLGVPTYTVFAGELASVDAELIRMGRMQDLRREDVRPRFVKKPVDSQAQPAGSQEILRAIVDSLSMLGS